MSDFKKWFAARARNPDKITLEEAFDAGASAQQRVQPAPSVPMDVIADYLVSISAHLARRDDAKAQAEIGELLKMIAPAPKPAPSVPDGSAVQTAARIMNIELITERDALRAKIEAMEQQEPVMWQTRTRPAWNDGPWGPWCECSEEYAEDIKKTPLLHDWLYEARALYTLPGAQTQGEEK